MVHLEQAKQTFIEESRDLLQSMEEMLLEAERGVCGEEAIDSLFRCAHTIKGSAGLFGFDSLVSFTHVVESVLERVRSGDLALEGELIGLLLACRDHIGILLADVAEQRHEPTQDVQHAEAALRSRLGVHLAPCQAGAQTEPASVASSEAATKVEGSGGESVDSDCWHISLRFGQEVFRNGMDPRSFIGYLGEIGTLAHVATLTDGIPAADAMDPECCYLGFEIDLKTDCDKTVLESAFDFVRDDCDIRLIPPHSKLQDYVRLIGELPEDPLRLGEILVQGGALTERELQSALRAQRKVEHAQEAGNKRLGEIIVEDGLAPAPAVGAALEKQQSVAAKRLREAQFVKVPAERLDGLINLVGELVIAGAAASTLAQREQSAAMIEAVSQVSDLVEDIRDAALRLRMVPIGETFGRFPRVVRDVAHELGKQIELQISGADTELDKSMVEKIADPLMHLVRNAIDHGIEAADLRAARGKARTGVLRLAAHHDAGSIVIEVGDDGGGLDRAKIRAKALAKGMLGEAQSIADAELLKLILAPGLSTADQVTNLSGRGVGMDVVRRNVEALRGTIEIESLEGRGTTIKLRMPLTLAIIDGFLVQVDAANYVIPLDMVVECVELTAAERQEAEGRHFINLRGAVLPLVRLRRLFDLDFSVPARENVVVVSYGGVRAGLVVDKLLGELQAVIKPLSKLFSRVEGIGGSTVLGTGEVALILDVPGLVGLARARHGEAAAA